MPTLDEIKDEMFGILKDQFKEADIWEGDEDIAFTKKIATMIAVQRYRMLTGSAADKVAAKENLRFIHQRVKNEVTERQIKLKGFGQDVLTAIVKTVTKVLISTAIGMI